MAKPILTQFGTIIPLLIQRYETYLPTAFDESMSILQKINKIIQKLDEMGQLTNDIVLQWNEVMKWVMDEGIHDGVIQVIEEMIKDGRFDTIIGQLILGDISVRVESYPLNDGETDDTLRVQRAIDATPEKSTLVFKHGKTYNIKSLTVNKAITINLNGANFIVDPTTNVNGISGSPFIYFVGSKGIQFDMVPATQLSSTVTLATSSYVSQFVIGDYVLIEDNKVVLDWTNVVNTGYVGRSEINYIKGIDSVTGSLILNTPIEWTYDATPKISKIGMLLNPTIVGNGATITELDPMTPYILNEDVMPHIFSFRYCVNPKVSDFSLSKWQLEACNFKYCVNPQVDRGYAVDPLRPSNGGHGYFTRFDRCSGGNVTNSVGKNVRHMVDFVQSYQGSSSFNTAYGCKYGAYMTHGLGSKRCSSINDKAIGCDVGWAMGNYAFNADYEYDIINPVFIGDLGVAFRMTTNSKGMRVVNPDVETGFRALYMNLGANGFTMNGGKVNVKDGAVAWETFLIRPKENSGDVKYIIPKDVVIKNVEMTGRVYTYYQGDGSFTFSDNIIYSSNATTSCVWVDSFTDGTTYHALDVDISDNKILGVFDRGVRVSASPSRSYKISGNFTSGHITTPMQLSMLPILRMINNHLTGATDFWFSGDRNTAIIGGAVFIGNRPNVVDTGRYRSLTIANAPNLAKSISISSGTLETASLRWLIQGNVEDVNSNGTDLEIVARNNDGSNKGAPFVIRRSDMITFMNQASVVFAGTWDKPIWLGSNRVWVDATGKMRIKPTAPTSDLDGSVVGAQV